jgi:23S rRNA (cytidine1920-2'-O)/16S rRNA (cytidine1409-2'-O)-methyltransferase
MRRRLDAELVRRGLAQSRSAAADAIRSGRVTVAGRSAMKAGTLVAPEEAVALAGPAKRFVSRAGEKLAAAIDRFGVVVEGRRALDVGASTGGFTDVLLRRGAAAVAAVDVGYGQLAWSLRIDPRVTVLERTNARDLRADVLPFRPDLITADVSFISLRLILPALGAVATERADAILLVKPQFEAGRLQVSSGGVVRDPAVWAECIRSVADAATREGFDPYGAMASPVQGHAGNVEFLLHAVRDGSRTSITGTTSTVSATPDMDEVVARAVDEGVALRGSGTGA